MCVTIKLKLEKPCKLWTGHTCKRWGYGHRGYKGKVELAHRVAYAEANGLTMDDIRGLVVRHKCDNPPCVEPTHLILGTVADNNWDTVRRGRHRPGGTKGEAHPQHKLTAEQVKVIKRRLAEGYRNGVALAKEFEVNPVTVQDIKHGRTWKHIV